MGEVEKMFWESSKRGQRCQQGLDGSDSFLCQKDLERVEVETRCILMLSSHRKHVFTSVVELRRIL